MVSKRNQSLMINVGFLMAIIVGVANMLTLREIWIVFAVVLAMAILIAFTIKETHKLKHKGTEN
jgi:energy-coupling factor transporter transmembrane protein EcfT